jgi:hypothetical protein
MPESEGLTWGQYLLGLGGLGLFYFVTSFILDLRADEKLKRKLPKPGILEAHPEFRITKIPEPEPPKATEIKLPNSPEELKQEINQTHANFADPKAWITKKP